MDQVVMDQVVDQAVEQERKEDPVFYFLVAIRMPPNKTTNATAIRKYLGDLEEGDVTDRILVRQLGESIVLRYLETLKSGSWAWKKEGGRTSEISDHMD